MRHKLSDMLNDFRTLSHGLLPRSLGETSIVGPIRQLVSEFGDKAGFEIECVEQEVSASLHAGTTTTLYRLLQKVCATS